MLILEFLDVLGKVFSEIELKLFIFFIKLVDFPL